MNSVFNANVTNPFMAGGMVYGGNFIDVLFRHLLENGWQGLSIMTIINFYLYLSLDKIKEFFKIANEKLAEYANNKFKYYVKLVIDKSKQYSYYCATKLFSKIKMVTNTKKILQDQTEIIQQKNLNKINVTLNFLNKTDLMALGNFLMKNKKSIYLNDYNRDHSDQYKTMEKYTLPDLIILNYDVINIQDLVSTSKNKIILEDDIIIKIIKNMDFDLICESDNNMELLKEVKIKNFEGIVPIISKDFHSISKILNPPFSNINCPPFEFSNWSSNPYNFCNGKSIGILFYIYYTKNFSLFKNFYKFLITKETFDFLGKKYKLIDSSETCSGLQDDDKMAKFWESFLEYHTTKFLPFCNKEKIEMDKWIFENKSLFDNISNKTPAVNINFESAKMSCSELSAYSRCFMNNLIKDYYHQNNDRIGNKISIYQLKIKYNHEIKKKENPNYASWIEKYGEKNIDSKEEKDIPKDSDQKENTTISHNDRKEKQGGDKFEDKNTKMYRYNYFKYKSIPTKPNKYIEEEILIPEAESVHIKTDKKPFQYLYLQKSQKDLLESYLSNFKDNRELYEKMGIPYKGGILLSGSPGCGKSSTIMAIATYLNKDIFYMDLGKIKNNHELKLCIDFVKTNSQKGGIIIFEDIDCMTEIVKRRDLILNKENIRQNENSNNSMENNSITKNIDTQNDKLSLSFLLNILDGTMSPENIIFVMTTNHIEQLDPALVRPGRMDINIEIKKCCKFQLQQIYFDLYGKQLKENLVERFKEYKFITAEIIMHLFHNIYNKELDDEELLKKFLE
ncbi:Bifunctional AAA family ATPase chaperone/translocase BCS1 [uncultured virus]|nr:Bifunctional AAA family ATPase chaperone/translocase BCS1 [uncultured virus]